jgi:hypothetical protein
MVLRACNPAFRSVNARVLESIHVPFGPQSHMGAALPLHELPQEREWRRVTMERAAVLVALAVSRAAAEVRVRCVQPPPLPML